MFGCKRFSSILLLCCLIMFSVLQYLNKRLQPQVVSPIKKLKTKQTFSKKAEKVIYSPSKSKSTNNQPQAKEFHNFQRHIRSKLGFNLRPKNNQHSEY